MFAYLVWAYIFDQPSMYQLHLLLNNPTELKKVHRACEGLIRYDQIVEHHAGHISKSPNCPHTALLFLATGFWQICPELYILISHLSVFLG